MIVQIEWLIGMIAVIFLVFAAIIVVCRNFRKQFAP